MIEVFRVSADRPVMKKLEDIFTLMDKLGVRIDVDDNILMVHHDGQTYKMLDLEQSYHDSSYSNIPCLPPHLEYKLCYEKELIQGVGL
jgi:hypothetical protein